MRRLIFAVRAFWVLLMDLPHVYSDSEYHSIVGSGNDVEEIMEILVTQYNNTIEQENVLDEAKKIIE
jgi:hypothetical protein